MLKGQQRDYGASEGYQLSLNLLMPTGACSCEPSEPGIMSLSQSQLGRAVVILVGGANEALYAVPGSTALTLRNRKGFGPAWH